MARRPPNKRVYYHLFFAQVIALVSTGVATIALALLAYKLAGAEAGAVMGAALAIKMLAYMSSSRRLPPPSLSACRGGRCSSSSTSSAPPSL